ncbi:MAG: hypothetical protein OES26_05505 [Gammaproteobacteria bacterium]|nr:hypothetical protein [Gammaproteobacteria bacterium]
MIRATKIFAAAATSAVVVGVLLYIVPIPRPWLFSYIEANSDYFLVDRRTWESDASLPVRFSAFALDLKMRAQWKRDLIARLAPPRDDPRATLGNVYQATDQLIINQIELFHKPIDQLLFASLMRGYGWCDQVNGVIAYLLQGHIDDVETYSLYNAKDKLSPHVAVRTQSSLGTVFVDVWSGVPYFGFADQLSERGSREIPTYHELRGKMAFKESFYRDGSVFNRYDFWFQVRKGLNRSMFMLRDSWLHLWSSAWARQSGADAAIIPGDRYYLRARLHHIYGEAELAQQYYRKYLETPCTTVRCDAARIFLNRLSETSEISTRN